MNKSEREIAFMTIRNNVTSSSLPFMNGVQNQFRPANPAILLMLGRCHFCQQFF